MNTAGQVDDLIVELIEQVDNGGIPLSEAAWQTALACVGWPYVYSAWGALCTPSERKKRFKLCPDKTSIKAKCQVIRDKDPKPNCIGCQWYPDEQRVRCFDCRGFTHWVLLQYGFDLEGDIVSSQWNSKKNWCVKGQIGVDPIPQNVLVNVFIKNKTTGKWTHTGLYFNGSTCECASGVQYFEKMKSNRWTHWAIAKCFASNYVPPKDEPQKEDKPMNNENLPTLRKGSKGEYVTLLQTKLVNLGYNIGKSGIDGDFGSATLAAVKTFQKDRGLTTDGVVGKKTWEALMNNVEPQKLYTVTIKGLTKTIADEIVGKYGGTITAE